MIPLAAEVGEGGQTVAGAEGHVVCLGWDYLSNAKVNK